MSAPGDDNISAKMPVHKGKSTLGTGTALGLGIVLLLVGIGGGYFLGTTYGGSSGGPVQKYTITETGSSLVYPYMNILGPNFTSHYPGITISTASTGSGTGISSAEQGLADLGATDAFLTPSTASNDSLINFPMAISAQLVYYNLPGVSGHLNLNGTVLAMIYQGTITSWNDPLIQAANPGVSLPAATIQPIYRSDGSGDTALFTELCYMSWPGWSVGHGTTVTFPVGKGYKGNSGMVTGLQATQDGIAYIGISYESEASAAGLSYAALGDQTANVNGIVSSGGSGQANYILPTQDTISQDANLGLTNLLPSTDGLAINLILGGGAGAIAFPHGGGGTAPTAQFPSPYPDVNLEYVLVSSHAKDATKQKWVVTFLEWALANEGSYTAAVGFVNLTPAVVGYDMQALGTVQIS